MPLELGPLHAHNAFVSGTSRWETASTWGGRRRRETAKRNRAERGKLYGYGDGATGCRLWEDCETCPLPRCAFERPRGEVLREASAALIHHWGIFQVGSESVTEIAKRLSVPEPAARKYREQAFRDHLSCIGTCTMAEKPREWVDEVLTALRRAREEKEANHRL